MRNSCQRLQAGQGVQEMVVKKEWSSKVTAGHGQQTGYSGLSLSLKKPLQLDTVAAAMHTITELLET